MSPASPVFLKTLGTVAAAAIMGAANAVAEPYHGLAMLIAGALLGALHIQRPGDTKSV